MPDIISGYPIIVFQNKATLTRGFVHKGEPYHIVLEFSIPGRIKIIWNKSLLHFVSHISIFILYILGRQEIGLIFLAIQDKEMLINFH